MMKECMRKSMKMIMIISYVMELHFSKRDVW